MILGALDALRISGEVDCPGLGRRGLSWFFDNDSDTSPPSKMSSGNMSHITVSITTDPTSHECSATSFSRSVSLHSSHFSQSFSCVNRLSSFTRFSNFLIVDFARCNCELMWIQLAHSIDSSKWFADFLNILNEINGFYYQWFDIREYDWNLEYLLLTITGWFQFQVGIWCFTQFIDVNESNVFKRTHFPKNDDKLQ